MSNLPYKNPISPLQVYGSSTVDRSKTFGTNFSVLGTGGFMEVYNLSDLDYTIPEGNGPVEFSGNTIPIQFKKGTGSVFSPDVLTLNSDNISSGRRRLGMLVYVYETGKIYQHTIDDYDNLWLSASTSSGPGGATVVISDFGTTVKNNTVAGQNFINAWTASTIEGVSGYTNLNATWRILKTGGGGVNGDYLPLSGGTVTGDTIFQSGLTAYTISATTYYNLPISALTEGNNISISGDSGNYTISFTGTTGSNFTGGTVSGPTNFTNGLSANTISATTYSNLPIDPDTFVTGFTISNDEITLSQNRDDSFSSFTISLSALTGVTSVTTSTGLSGNTTTGNITLVNTSPDKTVTITGGTNIEIISDYPNFGINFTGQTSFPYLPLSGGTVTGETTFQSGLTATTIYATNYQNLPIDVYTTAFTYSNNTFTIKDSSGNTFNSNFNTLTGLTINGNLSLTGNTSLSGVTTVFGSGPTFSAIRPGVNNSYDLGTSFFRWRQIYSTNIDVSSDLSANNVYVTNNLTAGTVSATTYYNLPIHFYITGSTPGVTIFNGDRWYNTNSGVELVYIDDGNSSQWVQPANTPGPPGYSNLMITSGITISAATLDINTNYYGVNYNGNVNLTLPNPSGHDGYNMTIKDEGGYCGTYRIRLTPLSGLIDGNTYVDMNLNYIALHLVARNNNWWLI